MASKRKYGILEASSEPTRYELRERTAQGKVVRVTGRSQPSLQDPFHVLGDHEVREIITNLEARDTETLRRVSRLWKASAEYHCERSLLLRHFPWMATKITESTTREELNLLFRRCLYQQESLKAGLATRAVKFSGAREWHVHDDRIVWSNLEESTSTGLLRSSKASSSSYPKTKRLNIQKLIPMHWHVKFVQAIPREQILVTAEIDRDFRPLGLRAHKLILVSLSGSVKWIADVKNPSSRPAIGKASIYLINYQWATVFSDDNDGKMSFMKLDISTGSVEVDNFLLTANESYGARHGNFPSYESLVLSMDETYAIWVDQDAFYTPLAGTATQNIICTTTGSIIYKYDYHRRPSAYTAMSSITQNAVWNYGRQYTYLISQDPYDKSWATRCIRMPSYTDRCYPREPRKTVQLGFEGDRLLFSHLIHSKPSEFQRPARLPRMIEMRTSKFGVSSAVRGTNVPRLAGATGPPDMQYVPATPSVVTLPDGNGGRRELEVKLPWSEPHNEVLYFGFTEGLIAYHVRRVHVLLLIDFWPDW